MLLFRAGTSQHPLHVFFKNSLSTSGPLFRSPLLGLVDVGFDLLDLLRVGLLAASTENAAALFRELHVWHAVLIVCAHTLDQALFLQRSDGPAMDSLLTCCIYSGVSGLSAAVNLGQGGLLSRGKFTLGNDSLAADLLAG